MIIPKSVNVLGQKFKVIQSKAKVTDGNMAEVDLMAKTIFIDDTLNGEEKMKAYLHELGHCVMFKNGVRFSGAVSAEFEEVIVETYASAIYDMLKAQKIIT